MRVILAGGGTGGHVIPALAIARELRDLYDAEILFIGTSRGIENRLVPAAGFPLQLIEVGALKKVGVVRRLKTLFALPSAVFAAWRLLHEYRPNVVIGVGGYASGPAMLAAVLSRVPTLAFEPNLVPGFANRVVARFVGGAAVHFQQTARFFRRAQVTGVPVRREFFQIPERIPSATPTLLIFGGSQGARAINHAVAGALPALTKSIPNLHLIHQTGERDYQSTEAEYVRATMGTGLSAEVSKFIEDMPHAFAAADLVLCRSGASTVAEITAAGKPAIFVPYPHAADDHQRRNAEALSEAGAALLIPEAELTSERLEQVITTLFTDRPRLAQMGRAARGLSHPDAARKIAHLAAQLAGKLDPRIRDATVGA
ncbi:MAG: undecaprenyldiphospho-muramoylpentapeptide beta-N-acetylglucosaminyltransferase [Candidatus Korobacteraceae bacterium]